MGARFIKLVAVLALFAGIMTFGTAVSANNGGATIHYNSSEGCGVPAYGNQPALYGKTSPTTLTSSGVYTLVCRFNNNPTPPTQTVVNTAFQCVISIPNYPGIATYDSMVTYYPNGTAILTCTGSIPTV